MTQAESFSPKPHIALRVKDLGRSVEFYRKLFGVEPVKLRSDYAKFDLAEPALNFALNQIPEPSSATDQGALSHLGIQVGSTAEVLATRERWQAAGLETREEMKIECCYASQDKTWARDPDGNEWEVFVVLEDIPPERAVTGPACCTPTCCAKD